MTLVLYFQTHPQALAVLLLALALVCNWGLGVARAIVVAVYTRGWPETERTLAGAFAWSELPRILRSQFATVEMGVLYAGYGGTLATAVVTAYLQGKGILDTGTLAVVVAAAFNVVSAGAAVYSAAIWREDAAQLAHLFDPVQRIGEPLPAPAPVPAAPLPGQWTSPAVPSAPAEQPQKGASTYP